MEKPPRITEDVDLDRPSPARMYDYFLGGSHNFKVDRDMAEQIIQRNPDVVVLARANRAFLRRAVRFMISEGVAQFLDIGSGIPTVGNVHEIAHRTNPTAHVVYVDIDPVAVAHSRAILKGQTNAAVVRADLRRPETILDAPEVARLLDLSQPLGLLLVAVLPFLPDDEQPQRAVAQLRDALCAGSYLAVSHPVLSRAALADVDEAKAFYEQRAARLAGPRSVAEVAAFLGDFQLVEPGLVYVPQWRPDSPDEVDDHSQRFAAIVGGVGRKP